jgi:two-component sensor histidine kinase
MPSRLWRAPVSLVTGVSALLSTQLRSMPRTIAAWWPTLSVRNYLTLITLFAVLPLIGLAAFIGDRAASDELQATRTGLMSSARSLAAAVDREIDKHIAVATTLTYSRPLLNGDWTDFRQHAEQALAYLPGSGLIVADVAGQQLLNLDYPHGEPLPMRVAVALSLQERAFATGQPQVSDLFQGRDSRRVLAAVDVPVFRNGAPLYVLAVRLDPEQFRRMLREQDYPADWYAAVLDRNGSTIARLLDPDGNRTGEPASDSWRKSIERAPEGLVENSSVEGVALVNAYTRTAHGWTVGIAIRKSALEAPLRQTRLIFAVAALGCIGLSLLLVWAVARKFDAATRSLRAAASTMAEARPLAAPQATGIREYDELGAAFADASSLLRARADERARAEDALGRRVDELAAIYEFTEKRFRATSVAEICEAALDATLTALHCSRASILLADGSGVMRFVAWRGLSERYRKAVEGRSPWTSDDKDPQPVVIRDIDGADVPGPVKSAMEEEGIRALAFIPVVAEGDLIGKCMIYHEAPHGFTDAEMKIAVNLARRLGFAIEHKHADEARHIATHELQHRSNNLLAVIQAIARKTLSGADSLDQARQSFEDRLQALARAHRQLTSSNWSGVPLDEIVRLALEPFGPRSNIEGGDVMLRPKHAQNFSLALHELATNSVKHGALSSAGGRISIAWAVTDEGEDRILKFQWREQGGPPVATPDRYGFGTSLLKATFPDVRFDYAPEGLMCEIDVPLGKRDSAPESFGASRGVD